MNTTREPEAAQQPQDDQALPIHQRHSVTVEVAHQYSGISRTRLYESLSDGTIEGKVVAGRRVVIVESLLRFIESAPSAKRELAA